MKSSILSADGRAFDNSLAWRVLKAILYMSCLGLIGSCRCRIIAIFHSSVLLLDIGGIENTAALC